jgi:hypothetical protein
MCVFLVARDGGVGVGVGRGTVSTCFRPQPAAVEATLLRAKSAKSGRRKV